MKKGLISKIFVILLVVGLLFAAAPTMQAQAADLCVKPGGGDGCYATIQAAITAAAAGDKVNVAAGTYVEDVIVNKAITLQGAGMDSTTVVGTNGNATNLNFATDGATVQGFHFTHVYTQAEKDAWNFSSTGVTFVQGKTGNTLKDSKVTLARNGIYLNNTTGNIFEGNVVENNRTGFNLANTVNDTQILNNTIKDNWTLGIVYYSLGQFTDFSTLTISGNSFIDNWNSEILIKDAQASTGTLNVIGNTFGDSPVTYTTSADAIWNEPGHGALKPVEFGGSATMPTTPYPTLRIYNSPGATLQHDDRVLMVGADQPYVTIQAAIDAADSGDTINVAAGTYVENLTIDKALTLTGESQAGVIIYPAKSGINCASGSICPESSNSILVEANNVTISNLTIDGDNPAITTKNSSNVAVVMNGTNPDARNGIITNHAKGVFNNLEIHNVTVKNIYLRGIYASSYGTFNIHDNTVTNVDGGSASIGIFAWGGPGIFSNNTVSYANDAISANWSYGIQFLNNTVTHSNSGIHTDNSASTAASVPDVIKGNNIDCTDVPNAYGIFVFVPYKAATIEENTVTNCAAGVTLFTQAQITDPVVTVVKNNTLTGNGSGSGIFVTTIAYPHLYSQVNANITGNTISGFGTGVQVWAGKLWDYEPWAAHPVNVTLTGNKITGNPIASATDAANGVVYSLDFTKNWWGSASGPAAGMITGDISYIPWCTNEECTTFGYPPVYNVNKGIYYVTIQSAIDAADDGDVIEVADGTYDKTTEGWTPGSGDVHTRLLDIRKPITLRAVNDGNGVRPVIDGSNINAAIRLKPSLFQGGQILIEGFEIRGNNATGAAIMGDFCASNNPPKVIIQDNLITGALGGLNFWANEDCSAPLSKATENFEITNNTFTNLGAAGAQGYGIVVENLSSWAEAGNAFAGVISGNSFSNISSAGSDPMQAGVGVIVNLPAPAAPGSANVHVLSNTFGANMGADIGIFTADASDAKLEKNKLGNGVVGVYNGSPAGTADARRNWWGAATGPEAGSIVGTTGYLPYCTNEECTEFSKVSLYMTPATIAASCTGEYEVEVWVDDVYTLQSYDLKLEFDHERIQIVKVENGTLLSAPGTPWFGNDLGNDDGKLSWGWAPTGIRMVDGSGSLIKITFKVTQIAGDSTFTILSTSLLNNWPDATDIPFEITGGAAVSTASIVTNTSMTPNKSYCDLGLAISEAGDNHTLRMDADYTTTDAYTIEKALTLNLDGHTITRDGSDLAGNVFFTINPGGNVKISGTGKIETKKHTAFQVNGGKVEDTITPALLTLEEAQIIGPYFSVVVTGNIANSETKEAFPAKFVMTGGYAFDTVSVRGLGGELDISGGEIAGGDAIMGNGSPGYGGTVINIHGNAKISGAPNGIYHPQMGILNVSENATITGDNGIDMRRGTLNISGGSIKGVGPTNPADKPILNGDDAWSGSVFYGSGVLLYSRNTFYPGEIQVNISGGTIESVNQEALYEFFYADEGSSFVGANITGGSFTGGTGKEAVKFTTPDTGTPKKLALTGGDYSADPIVFVYDPYGTSLHSDGRWYISDLPVLSSDDFYDPVTLGVASSFTLTVDPSVPGNFNMVFTGYPSETVITYGGVAYTCVGDPCVITVPVTLTGVSQDLAFGLVVATGGAETPQASYAVTATLHAPAPEYGTNGRDLAHLDATVLVTSGFSVSGTFTMQGRTTTKAGIPVTLTWNNGFGVEYGPTKVTTEDAVNFNLAVNYGGTYTLTTLQPRYLNVYAGLNKTFSVMGPKALNSLWLRAGNAVWRAVDEHGAYTGLYDNEINGADASRVGTDWQTGGPTDPQENGGDVNFDGVVNIKDLTLVGGNMDLTSATAYGIGANIWIP